VAAADKFVWNKFEQAMPGLRVQGRTPGIKPHKNHSLISLCNGDKKSKALKVKKQATTNGSFLL